MLAKSIPVRSECHACRQCPSGQDRAVPIVRVEAGEDIVIARRGQPVARLVACNAPVKRRPDVLKGKIVVPDTFFDALPEDELAAWEGR